MHLFINRFAHVINREQRDGDAGERFHFNAGLGDGPCHASYLGGAGRGHDVDLDFAQRQSVTKGNEMRGLFGGLDPGKSRGGEDVSLHNSIT